MGVIHLIRRKLLVDRLLKPNQVIRQSFLQVVAGAKLHRPFVDCLRPEGWLKPEIPMGRRILTSRFRKICIREGHLERACHISSLPRTVASFDRRRPVVDSIANG